MKYIEYPDRDMLVLDLVNAMASALTESLSHAERASLAVPGGTTPAPVFDDLSAVDLDWSRVDILLTDERWVPESHPRSNTRLLRERLLVNKAAAARLVPIYAPTETPEESLGALEGGIRAVMPISLLLLGMGTDMHTASLFPGADKLDTALSPNAPPLLAMRAPGAAEPRVTLTAPVLNGAMSKHLIILGKDKRKALKQARKTKDFKLAPVAAILRDTNVHWAK